MVGTQCRHDGAARGFYECSLFSQARTSRSGGSWVQTQTQA